MRINFKKIFYLAAVFLLLIESKNSFAQFSGELRISPRPSTRLADWMSWRETASLLITSDKSTTVKIEAKLSLNGSVIVSTKGTMSPVQVTSPQTTFFASDIFPENSVSFFGDLKATTMRSGILPEGSYELCITLTDIENHRTASTCRSFFLTKYIMPTLLQPENNKKIVSGTERTTLFVWTPVIPQPPMSVNYRLRIVEILPGQSAQQALTVNNPLFERTSVNSTQLLWPQEIPISGMGGNLAWAVEPEDESGNPLIIPERFSNTFTLIVLPSKEECGKLLDKVKKLREDGLGAEEKYWTVYEHYARITGLLEEAEERADALMIEKYKSEQSEADTKLEKVRITFDAARSKYDAMISEYEVCVGK